MTITRTGRLAVIPASVALALAAWTGTAAANSLTVDATCSGMALNMPRGETGTVVTTTLDGRVVRTDTVGTFGASLAFTIPSPDQTTPRSWVVTVDSPYNTDQTIVRSVGACLTPTSSTTITVPAPTTTVPPLVATSTVPAPSPTSTVPATTTTVPPVITDLPATGAMTDAIAFVAAAVTGAGVTLLRIRRMGAR